MARVVLLMLFAYGVSACGSSALPPNEPRSSDGPELVIPRADDVRVAFFNTHYQNDLWFAVPVACVTQEGTVLGNEACAPKLTGQAATLPQGQTVLGGLTTVLCDATGTRAMALVASIDAPLNVPVTWGHLGHGLPSGWHLASRVPAEDDWLADAMASLSASGWPLQADATDVRLDERLNLDGTRVFEAFSPSVDPDKPGHSALFLVGNDVAPLPTTGLSFNGRVRTPGAFPVRNNGHVLILTSEWMGGTGVHAVHLSPNGPVPVGEWACGT